MKITSRIIPTLLIIVSTAHLLSACGGAEERKAKYLERGKAYIAENNYDKAKVELKNVLQIDPKHAEAYYLIGQLEEGRQNWQQAFGNFSKALELNPDHLDARSRLGRLYLMAGETDKASEMMQSILAKDPANYKGRMLKGALLARKGDMKAAIKEESDVVAGNPQLVEAVEFLASLYAGQGDSAKAMETLINGIAANPKNVSLRLQIARTHAAAGDTTKAEQALLEITAVEPEKLAHRVTLAAFYTQQKQPDKAEKVLRDMVQASPKDEQRYILIAEFLATQRSTALAEKELQTAIETIPKGYLIRFGLARLYEQTNAADKAVKVYRDIIGLAGEDRDGLAARNGLARLLRAQGKLDEAQKLIAEVLKESPQDNQALTLTGQLALAQNDAPKAIGSFRSALRDQPGSVDLNLLLADAHMLNKEPNLAREALQKAVEENPQSAPARLALAKFYLRTGDGDGAQKKVDETLSFSPNDLNALQMKRDMLAGKRDFKGALAVTEKIKTAYPDNSLGYLQAGQLHLAQKEYTNALREFEQAYKRSKGGYQSLTSIVNVYVAQKMPEKALKRLADILQETPQHPFAHELQAEVYASQKQYDKAEQSLRKAIAVNPTWNIPYRNLGALYLSRGDNAAEMQVLEDGLRALPEDTDLLLHLAGVQERKSDFDKAAATYERVLKKNPNDQLAVNNLASLLADQKGDAASLKRAKELALSLESSPQPAFRDTLGWVYYKSGETDKAVALLKDVVKQAPLVSVFQYHLGMAYHKQGNGAAAKTHLAKAVEDKRGFPGVDEARTILKQIP